MCIYASLAHRKSLQAEPLTVDCQSGNPCWWQMLCSSLLYTCEDVSLSGNDKSAVRIVMEYSQRTVLSLGNTILEEDVGVPEIASSGIVLAAVVLGMSCTGGSAESDVERSVLEEDISHVC